MLIELLEVNLAKLWGPPWLDPPGVFNSQTCPHWASGSLDYSSGFPTMALGPEVASTCEPLLGEPWLPVCLSVSPGGGSSLPCALPSQGSKKNCWFFSLFSFCLLGWSDEFLPITAEEIEKGREESVKGCRADRANWGGLLSPQLQCLQRLSYLPRSGRKAQIYKVQQGSWLFTGGAFEQLGLVLFTASLKAGQHYPKSPLKRSGSSWRLMHMKMTCTALLKLFKNIVLTQEPILYFTVFWNMDEKWVFYFWIQLYTDRIIIKRLCK